MAEDDKHDQVSAERETRLWQTDEHHATPAQVSLAWMMCKKPWIVPIPGTRRLCRFKENIGAADIVLSAEEVERIDKALCTMEMSDVFGGSKIVKE